MHYIYHVTLNYLLVYLIPIGVLFILNIKLIRELKKAQKRHAEKTQQKEENRNMHMAVTLNIIVLVSVFLLCQTPDVVLLVLISEDSKLDLHTMWTAYYVKIFLLSLNASTNFLIYCVFYREFRQIFVRMICRGQIS